MMKLAGMQKLSPTLDVARNWFAVRTPREQILIGGLGIASVIAVLVLGVWRPMLEHRDAALSDIARYGDLLARAQIVDASQLRTSLAGAGEAESGSIAGSAADHGLSIRRIEPDGENTRIVLESVDFIRTLDWIAALETAGLARVSALQMERRPEPGTVNVQVTLSTNHAGAAQ